MKSQDRIDQTGEVFTPQNLVIEMLDKLPPETFTDPTKTILDSSCGNGQFLAEVLKRRLQTFSPEQALGWPTPDNIDNYRSQDDEEFPKFGGIFGVDLMADNTMDTIARLYLIARTGVDHWGPDAIPTFELPPHEDDHSYSYLVENPNTLVRRYPDLVVRHKGFNKNFQGGKHAGIFEFQYQDEPWQTCYNVVCFDALEYDYEFSAQEWKASRRSAFGTML